MKAIVGARSLSGRRADRGEFDITAAVRTYPSKDGDWACPVPVTPLFDQLADKRGVDSFQALSLAISLIQSLLEDFVETGGILFLDGDEFTPWTYLPPPELAGGAPPTRDEAVKLNI